MSVLAVKAFRKMRGGSQSQLMLCADERLWVVKFLNNPQHLRVLANEMIVTRLANMIGLPVPEADVIDVPASVMAEDPNMVLELGRGARGQYLPGQQFGSAYAGGLLVGFVVDYLPDERLRELRNLPDFAGMLVVDKWTGNCDGRQAVFQRDAREKKYRAVFIDQGFCFNAGDWDFPDLPLRGAYARNIVYEDIKGWESFEPWLTRVETMDQATLWTVAKAVPPQWYGGDPMLIESLMNRLFTRRTGVRDLILAFRYSERNPFPHWT